MSDEVISVRTYHDVNGVSLGCSKIPLILRNDPVVCSGVLATSYVEDSEN